MFRRSVIPSLLIGFMLLLVVLPPGEMQAWAPGSTMFVLGPTLPLQEAETEERAPTAQRFAHMRQERCRVSVPVAPSPKLTSPAVPRPRPAPDVLPATPEFHLISTRAPPAC